MRKKLSLLLIVLFIGLSLNAQDKPMKWNEPQPMWPIDFNKTSNVPWQPVTEQPVNQKTTPTYYYSPDGVYGVNPSFRVLPRTNSYQSEVILIRHPTNPLLMFGSSNAVNFVSGLFISEGVYVTTNGGVSWFGSDTLNGAPLSNHGGDPGPTIDKNGNIIMTHLGYNTSGMFGNYSTNNGLTWSASYTIMSGSVDKNFAGTDDCPTSAYYGRSYCVWTKWSSPYDAYISYTTNGGVGWSTPTIIIPAASGRINRAEDIRVGPNGEVYVSWTPTVGSNNEDWCAFAKSTNGGVTFTGNNNTFAMSGLLVFNNGFTPYGIRMNSFPRIDVDRSGGARNGWIYILVSQKNLAPAGSDPDIVLHRSTDGGTTWSAGIRVNQDPINNGKYQFFNAIRVDETGGVNCIYYDNRNTSADSAEVYIARSADGGNTWTEYNVSGHRFKPKSIAGLATGYAGDYIGITSGNNKVWGFWMDDITGVYQAWTASIDLGPSIAHTPLGNTEQINGTIPVNCVITPAGSGINPSLTRLYYAKNSTAWTQVNLTHGSGNNWSGNITLSGAGTYNYYLTTTDSMSRVATAPSGAPASYYSFVAAPPDTIKPVITHTPLGNCQLSNWPTTVSASVTDNTGIDSVWVKWYKNNTGTGIKQFKLILTSGTNYSAAFNSTQADVSANDSIFYRVFARDNSTHHNADSTALYKFKITNIVTITIGTGTSAEAYPISRYYNYSRWQAVYTKNEIATTGTINKIRFYQSNSTSGVTSGPITVYFKMVTDSTMVTGNWDVAGHTTVFNGTINNLAAAGWLEIVLTTPFYFNKALNQHLLISIQRDYQAWVNNYPTYNYTVVTSYKSRRNGDDAGLPTSLIQSFNRANIQMEINAITGLNNQTIAEIPEKYDLKQNYPNPFNPVTKISFDILKQGFVSLRIYDVLGREIRTLINEVKAPGIYNIDFDASTLSSGVYFYRLETNGFSDIKRMMLIK
jgi:hypothetical protein